MNDPADRRLLFVAAGLVIAVVVLVPLFLGGQTSKILSTVGNAVGDPTTGQGAAAAPEVTAPPAGGSPNDGQVAAAGATIPAFLIVRTGTLDLDVGQLDSAVRSANVAVARAGGYVSASEQAATTDTTAATVTYRIPSAAWDATLGALHGLAAKVVAERISTEEVSGQVVDLTARIANLRATEAALQAIMARATKIADVLDVQTQLTTTRGEIEQLVGQKAQLEDRAAYGSLAVTFRVPARPGPSASPAATIGWDPGADVARATGKLVSIGQTSTSIGIWLAIVWLPLLVAGALLALVAWQVYRLGRWLVRRLRTEGASAA